VTAADVRDRYIGGVWQRVDAADGAGGRRRRTVLAVEGGDSTVEDSGGADGSGWQRMATDDSGWQWMASDGIGWQRQNKIEGVGGC